MADQRMAISGIGTTGAPGAGAVKTSAVTVEYVQWKA